MNQTNSNMKDNIEASDTCCTPRCAIPKLGSYFQCSYRCWQFIVSVIFSIFGLVVGFIGLMGAFTTTDQTFYSNLITFILGVWLPSPRLKKETIWPDTPSLFQSKLSLASLHTEENEPVQTGRLNNRSPDNSSTARERRKNSDFIEIPI